MNVEGLRQFFKDWGTAFVLAMVGLTMLGVYIEIRKANRQELDVLAAKIRIERDRVAIAETRRDVQTIRETLQANKVPDRLERIEETIGHAVKDNMVKIQGIDERQQKIDQQQDKIVRAVVEAIGIPREQIDGSGEPRQKDSWP